MTDLCLRLDQPLAHALLGVNSAARVHKVRGCYQMYPSSQIQRHGQFLKIISNKIRFGMVRPISLVTVSSVSTSAANRLIGEVVQLRRMPLLGPSPG